MSRGYGTRGGTSATAGKRAETITARLGGRVIAKRVFRGQRILSLSTDAAGRELIQAWMDTAEAVRYGAVPAARFGDTWECACADVVS